MVTVQHNLIGLARVSTAGQDAGLQRDALVAAGCGRVFEETVSARGPRRPGLAAALGQLRPGDTLVVWKLDRLGRSVKDVLKIADDLHDRGVGLRVLTGALAGSYSPTGEGKFFFTMMAGLAELERDLIHERTMAGLAAARAHHRVGGRPTVMDPDKLAAARARRAKGESPTAIAAALGVSRATVYRHLAATTDEDVEQALLEGAAPAGGEQPTKTPPDSGEQPTKTAPASGERKGPRAPVTPRGAGQRWFVVEASSEDPAGPVVVISAHRSEKAAVAARGRVRRRSTGPATARYEVRTASGITARLEYDPGRDRAVVRDGPPV